MKYDAKHFDINSLRMTDGSSIKGPPQPVGAWRYHDGVNTLNYNIYRKPNWLHRWMMHYCFGLKWIDFRRG